MPPFPRHDGCPPPAPRWSLVGLAAIALAGCGSGAAADTGYEANDPAPVAAVDAGRDAARDAAKDASSAPAPDAPAEAPPAGLGAPYPIVLAHGFFGFDDFAGAHFLTYFYEVKEHLAAQGESLVFTPTVDPFNSSIVRGAELASQVQEILAQTGKSKVVLIGHSQGGLDARVVAHDHPDWVAGVVMIATPNQGTPVSDVVLGAAPGPISQGVVDGLGKLLGRTINPMAGSTDSVITALSQFSSKEIPQFNASYPDVPGIPYWSIGGRSFLSAGKGECNVPNAPPWIAKWSGEIDPCNPLLAVLGTPMLGTVNDGLVPLSSTKRGTFLGCVPADHLDQIGQILGQPPGIGNSFDYLEFWSGLVGWLRAQGL